MDLIEIEDNIHFGHFNNDTDPNDEMNFIDAMFEKMEIIDNNFIVDETWGWIFASLMIILFTALMTTIVIILYFPKLGFSRVRTTDDKVYFRRSDSEYANIEERPTGLFSPEHQIRIDQRRIKELKQQLKIQEEIIQKQEQGIVQNQGHTGDKDNTGNQARTIYVETTEPIKY